MQFLSIFDLDHTLLRINTSYYFGRHLYGRNILSTTDMLYMAACYWRHKLLGWPVERVHQHIFKRFFAGRSLKEIESEVASFLDGQLNSLIYLPAAQRLQEAQHKGHYTVLLSSSPQFLVRPIADHFGFDRWEASVYAADPHLQLTHISRLIDGPKKADYVVALSRKLNIPLSRMIAYTDSAIDLPLLQLVGKPIAVNPDRHLRTICQQKGWETL